MLYDAEVEQLKTFPTFPGKREKSQVVCIAIADGY